MSRIMIVEDEINIAKGLDMIIKSINSNIETTVTGYAKEALENANKYLYDIFLLDIQLYDYSGYELAKEIRNIDKYKLTPIVFITSIPTKELLAFKEIHCYDYIIKPFKEEEVINTIGTIINFGIKKDVKKEYIGFKQRDYLYRVKLDDIIYFEVVHRKIEVTTIKEKIELSNYTLYNILNELTDDFIRCHKGYIVNIKYIDKIDLINRQINLKFNNGIIPIGRKYKEYLGSVVSESN